jgi:hypothetical protein
MNLSLGNDASEVKGFSLVANLLIKNLQIWNQQPKS